VLALLAALAATALSCGPAAPNLDSPGRTIVCLGDSITAGVGAGADEAYPARLAARLATEVINAGVPGDTSEAGLARLDGVLARQPWLVIVELGGNDLLRQVPIERTERAMRTLLDRLIAARVVPLLVEIHGPFGGRYQNLFERLADDYDVPVVEDVLADVLADPALKSDQIHPNARGYEKLAAAVSEEVEPLIEARRKASR
jgi:lysophospholipase L1-like esterase